jgi:hypothetical protein
LFSGRALPVPRPENNKLYLKLRDDPTVINVAALNAEQLPPPPVDGGEEATPTEAPHSGAAGSAF